MMLHAAPHALVLRLRVVLGSMVAVCRVAVPVGDGGMGLPVQLTGEGTRAHASR